MTRRDARVGLWVFLLATAPACRSSTLTVGQVLVSVDGDLSITGEWDGLQMNVSVRGNTFLNETYQVGPTALTIPATLDLVQGPDPSAPVTVTATALKSGNPVVSQEFVTEIPSGQVVVLEVTLDRSCEEVVCPMGQTCQNGLCVTQQIPPSALSAYGADAGPPDAGDAGAAAVCGDTSLLQAGAPWPLEFGCPTNAGRSVFDGPMSSGVGRMPTGPMSGSQAAGSVGAGNALFVAQQSTTQLLAFNDVTGVQSWEFDTSGNQNVAAPAVDVNGALYATTDHGVVFSLDGATGKTIWSVQLDGAFSSPILAPPGLLYLGATDGYGFFALDPSNGSEKWRFAGPMGGNLSATPAVGGGLVYLVESLSNHLYALDGTTGSQVFDVPVSGTIVGSPVLGLAGLFLATSTDGVAAFDPQTGGSLWQGPAGASVVQPALLSNGNVVSSTAAGMAFVLDQTTGDQIQTTPLGSAPTHPPILGANDTAYFATSGGTVAVAPMGTVLWQSPLTGRLVIDAAHLVLLLDTQVFETIGP
jgi:hypothetical protein